MSVVTTFHWLLYSGIFEDGTLRVFAAVVAALLVWACSGAAVTALGSLVQRMRRWACAAVARVVGHRFRRGAPVRGLCASAYTAQERHAVKVSEQPEEEPGAVHRTEETRKPLEAEDEPDAVYLAEEMTPSLARLVAGTSMGQPQTRAMRTNLELLRRHNTRCSERAPPVLLLGRLSLLQA